MQSPSGEISPRAPLGRNDKPCAVWLEEQSDEGGVRIDFVYTSPTMMARVVDAMILIDNWTKPVKSAWYSSFYEPSDHHPILIDFEI